MSVPARTSSERRAWRRAAARKSAVGRMGRLRSGKRIEKDEGKRRGAVGARACLLESTGRTRKRSTSRRRGRGRIWRGGRSGKPKVIARQIRPSAGFTATTAYAGAHSAERSLRRVVSAGAAARAAVSVESAGSPERGDVSVVVCCAHRQREGAHELRTRRHRIRQCIEQRVRGGPMERAQPAQALNGACKVSNGADVWIGERHVQDVDSLEHLEHFGVFCARAGAALHEAGMCTVRGAEDEITLEEREGDAVAGAGDGVWCSVLSAFCYGYHLKSASRMTALECHGAR
ncbi:hypothetical protein B0H13DRAFT_2275506 [Mycena leptocephala]|nr:hypothetical protein B0H13DRAFT_2275506 [Mycena leptocephala]